MAHGSYNGYGGAVNATTNENGQMVVADSQEQAYQSRYGTTSGGLMFLNNNADSYINAVNQQALWDREDLLRKAAESREDTSFDRIVEAAKRNGINPIFLLDALSGNPVGQAANYSTSAAKTSSYDSNARTSEANSAKLLGALVSAIALIIASA